MYKLARSLLYRILNRSFNGSKEALRAMASTPSQCWNMVGIGRSAYAAAASDGFSEQRGGAKKRQSRAEPAVVIRHNISIHNALLLQGNISSLVPFIASDSNS
jgi:hypothetical protein